MFDFFIVQYGETPLYNVSKGVREWSESIKVMKILIDNGADLNVTDKVSHCQS